MTYVETQIGCATPAARQTPSLIQRILRIESLRRTRLDLSQLSDDQLRDIGLDRKTADKEARRPVWDAPENWHF